MYLFVLTHVIPKTVGGKIAAGILSSYVITHGVADSIKVGKRVTAWSKAKYSKYRGRVEEAAREGARQGTKEAHQTA